MGSFTENKVTLDAGRKNGEHPPTDKHRKAGLGTDRVPLSRQGTNINDPATGPSQEPP